MDEKIKKGFEAVAQKMSDHIHSEQVIRQSQRDFHQKVRGALDAQIETPKKLEAIESRISSLEQKASRPETRTWAFWFAVVAIVISLASLLRDYFELRSAAPAPLSEHQSTIATSDTGSQHTPAPPAQALPVLLQPQPSSTNHSGGSTLQTPSK
jgi:hypothetical protein